MNIAILIFLLLLYAVYVTPVHQSGHRTGELKLRKQTPTSLYIYINSSISFF